MISNDRRDHRLPEDPAEDEFPVVVSTLPGGGASGKRGAVRRLIKGIAGVGAFALLGVAALILWPLVSPPDPDASIRLVDGRLIGEASGYVVRVDREGQAVAVSASLLGLHPVVLLVSADTVITVQDRLGGFGDLWKDVPVRVSYELLGNTRRARSIEIVTGESGSTRRSVDAVPIPPILPSAAAPPASPVPAVDPAARRSGLERPVAPAGPPGPLPSSAASRQPTAGQPARPPAPSAADQPVTRTVPPGPSVAESVPVDISRRAATPSTDDTVADGTAAIDWLINESRRQ